MDRTPVGYSVGDEVVYVGGTKSHDPALVGKYGAVTALCFHGWYVDVRLEGQRDTVTYSSANIRRLRDGYIGPSAPPKKAPVDRTPPLFGIDAAWGQPSELPPMPVSSDPMTKQVGGNHYMGMAIQPMTYAMANNFDALQFTVLKYISRFRNKNGIEDLRKASHALDMLIAHEEKKATNAV